MRTVVLFDVHGNLAALDAVLAEAGSLGFDRLVCGGDYALFGPEPGACVERLQGFGERAAFIQGNTDRYVADPSLMPGRLGGENPAVWTAGRLHAGQLEWLAALPTVLDLPEHDAVVVHATPRSDEEQLFPDTPDADVAEMLAGTRDGTVLCGHVHVQYRRPLAGWEIVNPGSVGFPFDGDSRAAWAVLEDGHVELRRTAYPVEPVVEAVERSDNPAAELAVRRLRTARA
jgi:diadenosine tetraphosphatase ApaH/serine/threonine PP2A family protein phosphatase